MKEAIITINGHYNGRINYDHYSVNKEERYERYVFYDKNDNPLIIIRATDGITVELPDQPVKDDC